MRKAEEPEVEGFIRKLPDFEMGWLVTGRFEFLMNSFALHAVKLGKITARTKKLLILDERAL